MTKIVISAKQSMATQFAFSLEEIEDVIKNKDNLIYLLQLRGVLNRLLCSTTKDVQYDILEKCSQRKQKNANVKPD